MSSRHLVLEMTDRVFVEDAERARVVLGELKRLGVAPSLDDFGSGSALGHLQDFPIDIVKIDQRLVSVLDQTPARRPSCPPSSVSPVSSPTR